MKILRRVDEVTEALEALRGIGLVPTMGAFHEGHLSLFRAARGECDTVVASLFLNPAQFAPEDLERYPRDEDRDVALAEEAGVDFLFVPSVEALYPPGYGTWVEVDGGSVLEGAYRPDHFRGVATICLKLFNIVRPDRAYFGRKDAQQAALVGRLVRDLNLRLRLRVLPTVRDPDGLALSSRNRQLSAAERAAALALPRALAAGAVAETRCEDALAAARSVLAAEPLLEPDYVEIAAFDGHRLLVAAARVGRTRLIDNISLEGEPE